MSFFFFFPMASSSSPTSTVNTADSPSPTSLTTIHHLITIKLTRDNYLPWEAHIVPYLKGQHFYGYLDETTPNPPQVITIAANGDTQALRNLEFQALAFASSNDTQCYYLFSLWDDSGSYGQIYNLLGCLASIKTHFHLLIQGLNNANPLLTRHRPCIISKMLYCWFFKKNKDDRGQAHQLSCGLIHKFICFWRGSTYWCHSVDTQFCNLHLTSHGR